MKDKDRLGLMGAQGVSEGEDGESIPAGESRVVLGHS